ncbi:hypothetical protein TD95_001955 [Thielaviopsis punctulata]|uniref:non-reducing end alpha-L-arabinofuranosidase n=1 Tax=Thielaviopsis punctulata TaxID=72032 RepID=A0A0F4ZHK5_9PEZI|nr:hypothetical protein TD95_001955 [Thielaviopsis punctulata]
MTSYCFIPDDQPATLTVAPDHVVAEINDNIYGGFTEHMGRCIYGGIYDPGNPLSDENGFRKDVIEAMKELNVPVVRYPGGNFVATYHWLDGVGPREKRPKRPELAWLGMESNQFGTDEFLRWCEIVGTEPYLCLNFGTGTLDEALAWVEYCNSDADTYYANLRRSHGREKPWGVKYWALGNEMWGPWQIAQMTKEAYAHQAWQWAKALKLLDPSIQLILCGETGLSAWDAHVLQSCIRWEPHALGGASDKALIAMHSIHMYTADAEHVPNATAPLAAERAIQVAAGLIDLARAANNVPPSVPRPLICFDEWNVWDPVRAPGDRGAEETYTVSDALAVGVWLNVFVRQARWVGMANVAQSVNVISPLMTTKDGLRRQTTWWPLVLCSRFMRGHTVGVQVRCGRYTGRTAPAWLGAAVDVPWLDVSATKKDGHVALVVVNVHETKAQTVKLEGVREGADVVVHRVAAKEGMGVMATDVAVTEETVKWSGGEYVFPAASFTLLRWSV